MSFWFTKASRKGLAKKLRNCLEEIQAGEKNKTFAELLKIVESINETLNQEEFNREDLPHILNGKLYRDETIANLINIMPFIDQPTLNAVSTLFQTTIKMFPQESLAQYLIKRPDSLSTLLSYFEQQQNVSTTAHIIIRACAIIPEFITTLFENGVVGSFVKYLSGDNFDRLSTAFSTYETLLMAHPEITAKYFTSSWQIFAIQFKQLMSSPNYVVQLTFLPILFRFITNENCKTIFFRFLEDNENLQFIMLMLNHNSKKIQAHAYSILKLFVLNPRKTPSVINTLKMNKSRLVMFLKDFKIDDDDGDMDNEKKAVISTILELR